MKFIFNMGHAEVLDGLLFMASKSEQLKKTRKKTRILFLILILLLTFIFFILNKFFAYILGAVGILFFIFYPNYSRLFYRKYFTKVADTKEYQSLHGQVDVFLTNEFIESHSVKGEMKYYFSNIENITETKDYFFLKTKTIEYLLFPKSQIENLNELKSYFKNISQEHRIDFMEEMNWKWQ